MDISFPTSFIEETDISLLSILGSHQILVDCVCIGLFLASQFCSIVLCLFMPVTCCFDYYCFVIRKHDASYFGLFFLSFGFWGSFVSPYDFWDFFPYFCKITPLESH